MPPCEVQPHRSRDRWIIRYGLAVLVVSLATGIRIALLPIIPTGSPFLTFFLAILLAAWQGGLGPGLLASVLSMLAADFFLIEPLYGFNPSAAYSWISLGIFVVETVSITIVG